MKRGGALLCFLALLLGAPARPADGFFRGDEIEPRGWSYDEDYFTEVLSYSFDKTWLDRWEEARNGWLGTAGSLSSKDFYLVESVKMDVDVTGSSRLRFNHRRDEDYDSRYQVNTVEWRQRLWRTGVCLSALAQVYADKEQDDVGVAAEYESSGGGRLGVTYWRPDFTYNAKAPPGEDYLRKPETLAFAAAFSLLPPLRVDLEVGRNFPLESSSREENYLFKYDKTSWRARAVYSLARGAQVWLAAEGEETDKSLAGLVQDDFRTMMLHRSALRIRLEHFRPVGADGKLTLGGAFLNLDERSEYPYKAAETVDVSFRELSLYAWYRYPLGRGLSFEARLFLTDVDDGYAYSADDPRTWREDSLQARLGLVLLWEPTDRVRLLLSPSFDLDAREFGGGNLQLLVTL